MCNNYSETYKCYGNERSQFGTVTSVEYSHLVTLCAVVSDIDTFVPPILIFPRTLYVMDQLAIRVELAHLGA